MTNKPLYHAYSDDSPTLADSENNLAVAVVVTLEADSKRLAKIPKRVRQRLMNKKLRQLPELKFSNSDEKTRLRVLRMIANGRAELFVLIINKGGRQVIDSPLNNGIVLGNACAMVLEKKGRVSLTPDKKFTNPNETARYIETAIQVVADRAPDGFLVIKEPAESQQESLIQLADFVAGAVSHKYNRSDDHYFKIVEKKIVSEKRLRWTDIKADHIRQQKR